MAIDKEQTIGVLMGGLSSEREISLASGASVLGALKARGWKAVAIEVGRDLPARLVEAEVDVAWLALHGRYGEDGCVQGLLEVMGIPYTGSGVRSSAVAMDKISSKRALAGDPRIVMAADQVAVEGEPLPDGITFPCIVKPSVGGSTIGMNIARSSAELPAILAAAWKEHPEALLEELIEGDELTVAVLDGVALPVVRILPESGFFDFEAKYTKGLTRYEVPAQIPDALTTQAQAAAVASYVGLGCRGLARADFMVRDGSVPVFLEINTLPGMTSTSLSPMAAGSAGISFEVLVERVLLTARCAGSSA